MFELDQHQFERVRDLFRPYENHLVVSAAIQGETPGRVWVDKLSNPKTAVLWDQADMGVYFSGRYQNISFNKAFNEVLLADIVAQAKVMSHQDTLTFYVPSSQWEKNLRAVLAGTGAMPYPSLYFVQEPHRAPDIPMTKGHLRPQALDLPFIKKLNRKDPEHPLIKWGMKTYGSVHAFLEKCLVWGVIDTERDQLVAWCVAKYITVLNKGVSCELSCGTVEEHSPEAVAALQGICSHCQIQGIEHLGYHVLVGQTAEIEALQKAGFIQQGETVAYHAWVNPIDNYFHQAHYYGQIKEWQEQVEAYRKAFIMIDAYVRDLAHAKAWQTDTQKRTAYETAAQANIHIADYWGALDMLERAIFEVGWGSAEWQAWRENPAFDGVRHTAEWQGFADEVENALTSNQFFDDSDLPELVS